MFITSIFMRYSGAFPRVHAPYGAGWRQHLQTETAFSVRSWAEPGVSAHPEKSPRLHGSAHHRTDAMEPELVPDVGLISRIHSYYSDLSHSESVMSMLWGAFNADTSPQRRPLSL